VTETKWTGKEENTEPGYAQVEIKGMTTKGERIRFISNLIPLASRFLHIDASIEGDKVDFDYESTDSEHKIREK